MKKYSFPVFGVLIILCSCGVTSKAPEFRVGLVNFTSGTVLLSGPAGSAAAKPGDPVAAGMTVRTVGAKSLCDIYFDNTAVRITGDSILNADTVIYGKGLSESTALSLKKGDSFISSNKMLKGSSFSVKTQTAVAAVRGTEFFVSAGKDSAVSCLSGKVEVVSAKNASSSGIISSGEKADAGTSGVSVKDIPSPEKERLTGLAHVEPLSAQNAETFEKLRANDPETVARMKKRLELFFVSRAGLSSFAPAAEVLPPAVEDVVTEPVVDAPVIAAEAPKLPVFAAVTAAPAEILKVAAPAPKAKIAPESRAQTKSVSGGRTVPPSEMGPYYDE